ncbi:unnamed protein product, partial [Didymodactylos carnosus]
YLKRIDKVNLKGPSLHAVIETNPDALTIAHQLKHDHPYPHQRRLLPLYGIPILVKDNIRTDDKMNTTADYALLGSKVPRDAFVVKKLREAGAVILDNELFIKDVIATSMKKYRVSYQAMRCTKNFKQLDRVFAQDIMINSRSSAG